MLCLFFKTWRERVVPRKGLEPSRLLGHWHLKPARLPIPPPGHGAASYGSVARLSNCISATEIGCTAKGRWRIRKSLKYRLDRPNRPAKNRTQNRPRGTEHGIEPGNPGDGLWRVRFSGPRRGAGAVQARLSHP